MSAVAPRLIGLLLLAASPLKGQDVLYEFRSVNLGQFHGGGVGDLDGDGFDDFAVGVTTQERMDFYSGRDGSLLGSVDNASPLAGGFGRGVQRVGDLDGDGVADLLIGARSLATGYPDVVAHSGRTGAYLGITWGAEDAAGLDDVNGDGFDDIVTGAPNAMPLVPGLAYVLSGKDGSEIHRVVTGPRGQFFGTGVESVGDWDQDGVEDFTVSDPGGLSGPAAVTIYSGKDASILSVLSQGLTSGFGFADVRISDLDGDGVDDIFLASSTGGIAVNLMTGAAIYSISSPCNCTFPRRQVANLGDLNGDGKDDLALEVNDGGLSPGLDLFCGATGTFLYHFDLPLLAFEGLAVAAAGDVDADGLDDVVLGVQDNNRNETLLILAGNDVYLNASPKSPPAFVPLTLRLAVGPAGAASILYLTEFSGTPLLVPLGGLALLGPDGTREELFAVPPGLSGQTATVKGFVAGPSGTQDTAGETIVFQ